MSEQLVAVIDVEETVILSILVMLLYISRGTILGIINRKTKQNETKQYMCGENLAVGVQEG